MTPLYNAGGADDQHSRNAVMRNLSVIRNAPNNRINRFITMKGSWAFRDGSTQLGFMHLVARHNKTIRQIGHKPLMLPAEWQINVEHRC
jgi:hypothetical protein